MKPVTEDPGSHDDNYGVTVDEDNRLAIDQDFLQCCLNRPMDMFIPLFSALEDWRVLADLATKPNIPPGKMSVSVFN